MKVVHGQIKKVFYTPSFFHCARNEELEEDE